MFMLSPFLKDEWPLLVVVPASLRLLWAEELERWLPHLRPKSVHIIFGKTDRLPFESEAKVCHLSQEDTFCKFDDTRLISFFTLLVWQHWIQ